VMSRDRLGWSNGAYRGIVWSFVALPTAVLVASLVSICLHLNTLSPWSVVVHESGLRTLLQTILYFEHATRELPLDVLLGFAASASFAYFFPIPQSEDCPARCGHLLRVSAIAVGAVVLVVLGGSLHEVGPAVTLDNLLQKPLRDGVEAWGAHWRYHLLSRLSLIFMVFAAAGILGAAAGVAGGGRGQLRTFTAILVLFGALSVLFRPTLESFVDARFIGHQARELFTHTLVTVPLTLGTLTVVAKRLGGSFRSGEPAPARLAGGVYVTGTLGVVLGAYLTVGVLVTGAASMGQTESLARTVGAHFFEHSLGYALVPLVALLGYACSGLRHGPGFADAVPGTTGGKGAHQPLD